MLTGPRASCYGGRRGEGVSCLNLRSGGRQGGGRGGAVTPCLAPLTALPPWKPRGKRSSQGRAEKHLVEKRHTGKRNLKKVMVRKRKLLNWSPELGTGMLEFHFLSW